MNVLEEWLRMHPAFQALLLWPIVTGLLSFGLGWLEKRFPTFAAVVKASGLDAAGLVKLLMKLLAGDK